MKINGHKVEIVKSNRKTLSIQITPDLRIILRCPLFMSNAQAEQYAAEKALWIEKHLTRLEELSKNALPPLSEDEIKRLTDLAKEYIPQRVEYYSKIIGVDYGKITIRHQKTRWDSCTSKGNLSFNCLLMLTPNEVIDSVVAHELCHRLQMNHSKAFYADLLKAYPQYPSANKWLKENGGAILKRLI